ncbi:MAG: hypothetical protein ACPIOQ_36735, partial [Promethearchaeia archaeon]
GTGGPLTAAEQVAILDRQLEESTRDFDGIIYDEEQRQREAAREREIMMDPMLSRERRRGGQAFGITGKEDEGPDVHSKAAAAQARMQAKQDAKCAAAAEKYRQDMLAMEEELSEARKRVARARISGDGVGAVSVIESDAFALPNPGGGENLLEDCVMRLVTGHRYGLNGRNGKGKSTLLRHIAAQRVKGFPALLSLHYVAQEIPLAVINEDVKPVDMVLRADVEREMLLAEQRRLEQVSESDAEGSVEAATGLAQVMERLQNIDADSAEARARASRARAVLSAFVRRGIERVEATGKCAMRAMPCRAAFSG